MAAAIAILAALLKRDATGTGDFCDISMADGALSWLTIHAGEFSATGTDPRREEMHLSGGHPCYRVYPAADGYLSVGALEPQFWSALCDAIERPDLKDDAFATGERRSEVISELESLFSNKTRAEWMELFDGRDVCVGPVNSFSETFADDQFAARDMIFEEAVPGVGDWKHIGNPLKLTSAEKSPVRLPPPKMGEHTDAVLGELGIADRTEELRAAGVV